MIAQDIKPENMQITENGTAILGSSGLAAAVETADAIRSTVIGTNAYMAPEAFNGETACKSDVWSLGISLIELADGKMPYDGLNYFQVRSEEGSQA